MFRSILVSAAVSAAALLTLTAGAAAAAPSQPNQVPGPKPPTEHIAISGGFFQTQSGEPRCFTGTGSLAAAFQLPAGAVVTGATAYMIDSFEPGNVFVTLRRHDVLDGGTYTLASKGTTGAPGETSLELKPKQPAPLPVTSAINMTVNVGDAMCFKGAVVHFIRGTAPAAVEVARQSSDGFAPDGSRSAR